MTRLDDGLGDDIGSTFGSRDYRGARDDWRDTHKPPTRLPIVRASAFAGKTVPSRCWHVADWIPGRNVTLFTADGGDGKSTIALQLAVATVTGRKWFGMDVARGPVLYLSAEDEQDELHRRLAAIVAAEDIDFRALSDLVLAPLAGLDAVLAAPNGRQGLLTPTALFAEIKSEIGGIDPRLIIVDTLADTFGGDEIVKVQSRAFVSMLRGLGMEADAAVLLIAHPSMSGIASGSGTSGNVAWSNSVRSRLYMTRPRDAETKQVIDADARTIEVMKTNYGPSGLKLNLRWASGVFEMIDEAPQKKGVALDEEARFAFLDLLAQLNREGRDVSHKPGVNWAPLVFARHPAGRGIGKALFARAMDHLFADSRIEVVTIGPPSKLRTKLVEINPNAGKTDAA